MGPFFYFFFVFFYSHQRQGEVDVDLATEVTMSKPRVLFAEPDLAPWQGFDVNADGSRFLVIRLEVPYGGDPGGIVLVENWLALSGGPNGEN